MLESDAPVFPETLESLPTESNTRNFKNPVVADLNPNLQPNMAQYYVDFTNNIAQVPSRIYKAPKWMDGRAASAFLDNSLADGGSAGVHGNHGGQVGATAGAVGGGGLGAAALNVSDFRAYNSRTLFDYPSMYGCENLDIWHASATILKCVSKTYNFFLH